MTPPFDNDPAQQQQNRQTVCNFTAGIKEAVNPLMQKMVDMDEKLSKAHAFMLKGPESVVQRNVQSLSDVKMKIEHLTLLKFF